MDSSANPADRASGAGAPDRVPDASRLRRYLRWLTEPVDGASLAVFRILFGAIMLWEVFRYFVNGRIHRYFIEPSFYFTFLPFVKPWGGSGMYIHFAVMGVAAALVAVGLFYRVAAAVLCATITFVFLLDKTQYLNHIYLVCLVSFLMALVPANRAYSADHTYFDPDEPETIPRYALLILKLQIALVYFFGGIAKMNADWLLRAEPIGAWLREGSAELPFLGAILATRPAGIAFAWGGFLIDFLMGFLLFYRRTFVVAAVIAVFFNLTNAYVFNIGIFPYFMIASLSLYPDPSWPRRFLRDMTSREEQVADADEEPDPDSASESDSASEPGSEPAPKSEPAPIPAPVPAPAFLSSPATRVLLAFIHAYFVVQLLLPLRHWLYPGDVAWNEAGHRFSWRMKLRDKDVTVFQMYAIDPKSGDRQLINPRKWLNERQVQKMSSRPDMIIQLARHVADEMQESTGVRPVINVDVFASLNGAEPQRLMDPKVDLAALHESPLD